MTTRRSVALAAVVLTVLAGAALIAVVIRIVPEDDAAEAEAARFENSLRAIEEDRGPVFPEPEPLIPPPRSEDAPAPASSPLGVAPPVVRTRDDRDDEFRDFLRSAERAHEVEPVNRSWAYQMEQRVMNASDALRASRELSYEITGLSCRSETCLLDVTWPSYEIARREYSEIAISLRVPCGRTVLIPTPEDRSRENEYATRVVLHCQG